MNRCLFLRLKWDGSTTCEFDWSVVKRSVLTRILLQKVIIRACLVEFFSLIQTKNMFFDIFFITEIAFESLWKLKHINHMGGRRKGGLVDLTWIVLFVIFYCTTKTYINLVIYLRLTSAHSINHMHRLIKLDDNMKTNI